MKISDHTLASALQICLAAAYCCAGVTSVHAQAWQPVGPDGGDARAFAMDPANPSHLYLGSGTGWVYDSSDGGQHWRALAQVAGDNGLVLDNIVVNPRQPQEVIVGAYQLGAHGGGLYRSTDSGHTWTDISGMKGQSIRALERAESDPNILVAGTLLGVFRSADDGANWQRISPPENEELHEVESIAIDPRDPQIIYAGTWHLPWKTTNGGQTWQNVKQGLIDDSDVFSIILDPVTPSTVYLSACSGIYKSTSAGEQFAKVQGIPSTARRTRVLMQDPADRNTVYAGTTEGLYKTTDAGHVWSRMTTPDLIINDIAIDPRDSRHVLLATDRSGVMLSDNAGATFAFANSGVEERQVSALAVDPADANKLYAAVLNDKTYGGVFASHDGGQNWQQRAQGLAGRDVYSLAVLPNGDLLAGTNRGLALWSGNGPWGPGGKLINLVDKKTTYTERDPKTHRLVHKTETARVAAPAQDITARVGSVSISGYVWFAATTDGLYRSTDKGAFWMGGPVMQEHDLRLVSANGDEVYVASLHRIFASQDIGFQWKEAAAPQGLSQISALLAAPGGTLWVAGPEGVWRSRDHGQSWTKCDRLPVNQISSVTWDPSLRQVVITSGSSGVVFATADGGNTWNYADAGWPLRAATTAAGHFLGASLYHGVVKDPAPAARSLRSTKGN